MSDTLEALRKRDAGLEYDELRMPLDTAPPQERALWQARQDVRTLLRAEGRGALDVLRAAAQRREEAEEAVADYEAGLHEAWSETGEQPSDEQEQERGRLANELGESILALRHALAQREPAWEGRGALDVARVAIEALTPTVFGDYIEGSWLERDAVLSALAQREPAESQT